jgi:two-component system CheB/CheR fusion protein
MKPNKLIAENISIEEGKRVIIAIGASAGGLEALQNFLSHLPADLKNISIFIAQHVAISPKSKLVHLLSKITKLPVVDARNGILIEADTIYVTPADKDILVDGDRIILRPPEDIALPKPSIDVFFNSLSSIQNACVFAVILSGTGKDGSEGIKAIKQFGGIILVQDPLTAKFNSMPNAAIATGLVDSILNPSEMGNEILSLLLNPDKRNDISISQNTEEETGYIDQLFILLSKKSGTDFSNYKPSTIYRRIDKRLEAVQLKTLKSYLEYINDNPVELDILYNTILIGVTSFFRDKEVFDSMEQQLKKVVAEKEKNIPLRIWVIGCATGEEAYSVAILVADILKNSKKKLAVQIFATDIDENALNVARKGLYNTKNVETVDPALLAEYFTKKDNNDYQVTKLIRSMVVFSKHDITTNPPYLRIDLISCRNLLIYFGSLLQKHIIPIFHYSLTRDESSGYLFLGKSETIGIYNDLFSTIDSKNKIYQRKSVSNTGSLKFSLFTAPHYLRKGLMNSLDKKVSVKDLVKETLMNTLEYPYVIINENADIQESSGDLRLFISLPAGIMNANLFKLVNIELQLDMRITFTDVLKSNKTGKTRLKKFRVFDKDHYVVVNIKPIIQEANKSKLFLVLFEILDLPELENITQTDSIISSNNRIHEMDLELMSTKKHLQNFIEELETSNEELQSLNEELQSTNEELQSTSEELQRGNEELVKLNSDLNKADKILAKKEREIKLSVFQGEENGRKVIALELHDNISQTLSAAKMLISSYIKNKKEINLTDGLGLIKESIKEVRNLSHVVSLPKLVEDGLIRSIQLLLTQLNASGDIKFQITNYIVEKDLSDDLKINIYRIIQEQLNNITKHSKASHAELEINEVDRKLFIGIKDDGIGFDRKAVSNGIGLSNIETRVQLFEGKMKIISSPGNGCELKIEFLLEVNK